jgi:hypothetical protein|nr:MAG TPA: hypothetical protein [Caudoviricetes sp.]
MGLNRSFYRAPFATMASKAFVSFRPLGNRVEIMGMVRVW